jgi:HAD superfamily hydrolase (TIGR01509 family)
MATFWTKRNEDIEDEKTAMPWGELFVKGERNVPRRRKLRVALFDLDGTLVDTEDQYTVFWGATARKYRPDVPRLEFLIKGTTLTQIFDTYFPDPQWQAEITEGLNAYEAQMKYEFYPGALDFLQDLKRNGVQCAVVTSSNIPKIESVRQQIPNFDALFDKVLTAEDFTASKPAPDCYLLGARTFGADIDECVVFEDAYTGLQAGMASGIFTIGLATGHTKEEIADKCNHVLDSFEGMTYERLTALITQHLH